MMFTDAKTVPNILKTPGGPPVRLVSGDIGDDPGGPTLRMHFESAIGYRNVNESYRLNTWAELDMAQNPPLLVVENSSWLAWLRSEAGEVVDWEKVVHYVIFTSEDCLDIATEFPPSVEWLGSLE